MRALFISALLLTPSVASTEVAQPVDRAGLAADVLRLQVIVRDAIHAAGERLVAWSHLLDAEPGLHIPDVSVLRALPVDSVVTSNYGWREDPIRKHAKFHHGTDLRGKFGTPVMAAGDGEVVFCGTQPGYGNVIYVDHGGGVVTRYAHLQRLETKLHATVVAGQRIGQVGSTGRSTGPHLHFEVRLDGHSVDAMEAMEVARMLRESPSRGQLAAYALAPEVQAKKQAEQTPNKQRPERRGRVRVAKPNV
jgi:murein DD-endopeptidase MepM/ murein hydrolase activator NlpD